MENTSRTYALFNWDEYMSLSFTQKAFNFLIFKLSQINLIASILDYQTNMKMHGLK